MQGRVDEGLQFLASRVDDWGAGNLFCVHNWWHTALFHLEAGMPERALAIYDASIHNADSQGIPLEMLDASALLWRLMLDDVASGGRFAALADAWASRRDSDSWYVFNDLHAVMAFVGAGRIDDARLVIDRLAHDVEQPAVGTNHAMMAEIGLPACRAAVAYGEGRHGDVVEALAPIRTILQHFGGSHAQRDALQRTLLESALRSGNHALASSLLRDRIKNRETSV
jgi:hypothetical protein